MGSLFFLCFLVSLSALAAVEKEKAPTPLVFVQKIKAEELFDQLSYPARLVPNTTATLLAENDGIVRKISAPLGAVVKRDQVVMTIGNTDPVYQYAPMKVRAPVAGAVSSVEVTEGSRVTRNQRLGVITNPLDVKIQIEVAAVDLSAFNPGLTGQLELPSEEGVVAVRVLGISPFVDPATGTATVELALAEKKARLAPGLVGRVSFRAHDHQGIQISEDAIVYRGQTPSVRLVENGKAKYLPVTLGATRRGMVEILKGLKAGDDLVVRASSYVVGGEAVNVQKGEEPQS